MCPRKDWSRTPPTSSVGDERGFTNWPAIRPTLTTGSSAPKVSTAAASAAGACARSRVPRQPARSTSIRFLDQNPGVSMRIFSGIQPTGAKHIGNYAGGFRQYAQTQEQGDAFFCIVDLHSITVQYEPEQLRRSTYDLLAMLIASGLDPGRSTIFAQSHVPAHAEAAWLLAAVTSYGQLGRMTQFKEKGDKQEFVSAGLFTYPILMAGDILLYQTDLVPIGDDQRQHLELSRDLAERFNARFGATFRVPEA